MSKPDINNSMVIVFDGIDGVGKTTQISLASDLLDGEGYKTEILRNLGSTPIGEQLREVMLCDTPRPPETDLFISVAIQEALIKRIDELRQQGRIILMDRSPLSLLAYQSYGSGLSRNKVKPYVDDGINRIKPDLIIILSDDVESAVLRARQSSAKDDYFESKPFEFFERVSDGFAKLSSDYGAEIVDVGNGIDTAFKQIKRLILDQLSSY